MRKKLETIRKSQPPHKKTIREQRRKTGLCFFLKYWFASLSANSILRDWHSPLPPEEVISSSPGVVVLTWVFKLIFSKDLRPKISCCYFQGVPSPLPPPPPQPSWPRRGARRSPPPPPWCPSPPSRLALTSDEETPWKKNFDHSFRNMIIFLFLSIAFPHSPTQVPLDGLNRTGLWRLVVPSGIGDAMLSPRAGEAAMERPRGRERPALMPPIGESSAWGKGSAPGGTRELEILSSPAPFWAHSEDLIWCRNSIASLELKSGLNWNNLEYLFI